jgi:small subunit ribosomal protein S13
MARIAGVDLPKNKKIGISLRYLYGIGKTNATKILEKAGVDWNIRTNKLIESDVAKIRKIIDSEYRVEGDLRREIGNNIKRLIDLGSYRGMRHKKGLPVRGQRTHTNARTRKGPRKLILRSSAPAAKPAATTTK